MIAFDLLCSGGHRFESWFQSGAAFDRQQADGAIECPLCRSRSVAKAPMAPHVGRAATGGGEQPETVAAADQMKNALHRLRQHIEGNCDYVGARFPEEARRIFYGEREQREIYGEASADESAALRDEGIPVQPIPWLYRRDD
jgi:hypothetical protein